jgi:hypothetical protein
MKKRERKNRKRKIAGFLTALVLLMLFPIPQVSVEPFVTEAYALVPGEDRTASTTYSSWLDGWGGEDVYNGISGMASEDDADTDPDDTDWLGDTVQAVVSILIKNSVGTLVTILADKTGLTIENIVFGPIAQSNGTSHNIFQFSLKDGNLWGVSGALLYAVLRNVMFAVFAVQFIWILGVYLIRGTAKGKAELKDSIGHFVFLFAMLYFLPIAVDATLFVRDALLKLVLTLCNTLCGGGSGSLKLGVTDLILSNSEEDFTIAGALILCFTVGAGFYFAFDYIRRAIQQAYLFGVAPVVLFRSFSDKAILNKWVGHFITSLFVPVLDCIGLMLVCLIQSNNGGLASDQGPAILALFVFCAIIPCRNMVAQLFGMPVSAGKGLGLAAAAAMGMRMLSGLGKKGGGQDNGKPESGNGGANGGDGNTISRPDGQQQNSLSASNDGSSSGSGGGSDSGEGFREDGTYGTGDEGIGNPTKSESTFAEDGTQTTTSSFENGASTESTTQFDDQNRATYSESTAYGRDGAPVGSSSTSYDYDDGNKWGGYSKTTDYMDADHNLTGSSKDTYSSSNMPLRHSEYDKDGNQISSVSHDYDSEGNLTGSTRMDKEYTPIGGGDGNIPSIDGVEGLSASTKTSFDANGNRIAETSKRIDEDGTMHTTETQFNPETAKPISQTHTETPDGARFPSAKTETTFDDSGKISSQARTEYDPGTGNPKSKTETKLDDKGHASTMRTEYGANGEEVSRSIDNNAKPPKNKDGVRSRLSDLKESMKNEFVAPTTSTIDVNGNERKVADKAAIQRQIERADGRFNYPHKADGTRDWRATGKQYAGAAKTAAKIVGTGVAMSAVALGGGQAMGSVAATSVMMGGNKGGAQQSSGTAAPQQSTVPAEPNRDAGDAKTPRRQGQAPKGRSTGEKAKRTKPYSREAEAAKKVKDTVFDDKGGKK